MKECLTEMKEKVDEIVLMEREVKKVREKK